MLVHVLDGAGGLAGRRGGARARRRAKRVPIVACSPAPGSTVRVPYVLATDVVARPAGQRASRSATIADAHRARGSARTRSRARRAAPRAPPPGRRRADRRGLAPRTRSLGVAVFLPGVDFAVLTINQLRLVLRIAAAHGHEIDRGARCRRCSRVVGAGLGFRARRAPGARRSSRSPAGSSKGAIAYAGTRALGEAAIRYFEARAECA